MDTFDAIYQRRAVKHYDPEHRFSDEELHKLMEAVIQSPTSFNIQNWRFVLVKDPKLRRQVREAGWDQTQLTEASLLFVITGDLKSAEKEPQRYWRDAPREVQDMLVPMIGQFYAGREQVQRDEVMRSAGLAAQTMMLAAKTMGYDSCPMIGFDADKVAELIHLPEDHAVAMIVVVGKAAQPARPKGGQLPLDDVLVIDQFGK